MFKTILINILIGNYIYIYIYIIIIEDKATS